MTEKVNLYEYDTTFILTWKKRCF